MTATADLEVGMPSGFLLQSAVTISSHYNARGCHVLCEAPDLRFLDLTGRCQASVLKQAARMPYQRS